MKHAKMLALAAVAAGVLMALIGAGSASATVICSTTADPCPAGQSWAVGTKIHFTQTAGTTSNLVDTKGNALDTCKTSTVQGELSASNTGPVTSLTWGDATNKCTFPTTTIKLGKLEVKKSVGTSNGTVVADGTFEVTFIHAVLGDCVYGVDSGTSLGDLTEGNPFIFHTNGLGKEIGNKVSCPDDAIWTATYTLTSPSGTTGSVSAS